MRKKEPNTREHIIKNALRLFAQKGFFRTTMEDIATATGVAKGTVYLYFKDKQALYAASVEEQFNHLLDRLNEIDRSVGTPGHKMRNIASDLVDYAATCWPWCATSTSTRSGRTWWPIRGTTRGAVIAPTSGRRARAGCASRLCSTCSARRRTAPEPPTDTS